jgi:uncharacterized membrane protein
MNKTRLENLSDGVFAIVFTILVLDIRIPDELVHPSSTELWQALAALMPVFEGYFVSFAVLTIFWMAHSYFFSIVVKEINRQLVLLNMLYLAFVSLLPFAAYLLGKYAEVQTAVLVYGLNVLIIGILTAARFEYAFWSKELDTEHNEQRVTEQARVRMYSMVITTFIGILLSYVSMRAALFLYAFPIIFNIIPGMLNALERIFGFRLGERN